MKYAILRYPHQNSRYYASTQKLLENELTILCSALQMNVSSLQYETIGGLELLTFETVSLEGVMLEAVQRISSLFALFRVEAGGLVPMNEGKKTYFPRDMSSILKYAGKTNEDFTAMMINVGVFASAFADQFREALNIFDPMCGRGTTLYEGLIMGYNVSGVEIKKTECQEIDKYMKRYLKYHKFKHDASHQTIHTKDGKGIKYTIETADTTDHFKEKDRRSIQFANGNTLHANDFYKKQSFHVIVTDVPYGVQHSGTSKSKPVDMLKLLSEAADAWHKVLKKGGTVVISFNAYTLDKKALGAAFESAGYEVLNEGVYAEFEHWVEQAVSRDILVARKK